MPNPRLRRALLALASLSLGASAAVTACESGTKVSPFVVDGATPDPRTADATADTAAPDAAAEDAATNADASDAADAGPVSCASLGIADAGAPGVCSATGVAEAGMIVHNGCIEAVDLWWVDYACAEQLYATIPAGAAAQQDSFVTHPWRIRLPDAGRVLKEVPPLAAGTTDVIVP